MKRVSADTPRHAREMGHYIRRLCYAIGTPEIAALEMLRFTPCKREYFSTLVLFHKDLLISHGE